MIAKAELVLSKNLNILEKVIYSCDAKLNLLQSSVSHNHSEIILI